MNINDMTPQRREILDLVQFEGGTAITWPWAATAEEISQDEEKLKAVEAMLNYDSKDGYDTDQLYHALDQVFGTNPILAEQLEVSSGMLEQSM